MEKYTVLNDTNENQMVLTLTPIQVSEIVDQLPEGWAIRRSYASEKGNANS